MTTQNEINITLLSNQAAIMGALQLLIHDAGLRQKLVQTAINALDLARRIKDQDEKTS